MYFYNVQPGIENNYATGESKTKDGSAPYGNSEFVTPQKQKTETDTTVSVETAYIRNKNTKKVSLPRLQECETNE